MVQAELTDEEFEKLKKYGFKTDDKYKGMYTENQAEGAIPNGSTIVKVNSTSQDAHQTGSRGRVIGSIPVPKEVDKEITGPFGYCVEWDDSPGVACMVNGIRLMQIFQN